MLILAKLTDTSMPIYFTIALPPYAALTYIMIPFKPNPPYLNLCPHNSWNFLGRRIACGVIALGAIGWALYWRRNGSNNKISSITKQQSIEDGSKQAESSQEQRSQPSSSRKRRCTTDKGLSPMKCESFEYMAKADNCDNAIRERSRPTKVDSNATLRSVLSLSSVSSATSVSNASTQLSDDSNDGFFVRTTTPFPNGPIGSVEEEEPRNGKVTKTVQCGDGMIHDQKKSKKDDTS